MTTIHERIRSRRKTVGMTQAELAKIVGVARVSLTQWEIGATSPKGENLMALSRALACSPQWLSDGKEAAPTGEIPTPASSDDFALIPQYDMRASMGPGLSVSDFLEVKGNLAFRKDWIASMGLSGARLGIGTGDGDSMYPTIENGQVLLFNFDDTTPRSGKIYVISLDGEVMAKRLLNAVTHWIIRSDNPDKARFPDIEVSAETLKELKIHARVVWRGGEL